MNLRRQLTLVSLLTLILPWAGCQFIRETESALREGQQQMLAGTAQAIADSLSQYPYEFLTGRAQGAADQLYGHPLASEPLIDGYRDDWTIDERSLVALRGVDGNNRYMLGMRGQQLYLYAEVRDDSVVYASTSPGAGRFTSDHVELVSVADDGERTVFRFGAEAPGEFIPLRITAGSEFNETRISAFWRDTPGGYQLEARIPVTLLGPRLGIAIVNTPYALRQGIRTASFDGPAPGRFVTISPVLQSVASGYAQSQPDLRLVITDKAGWRLAVAGTVQSGRTTARTPGAGSGWLRLVYNVLLEPGAEALLAEPEPDGREQQVYVRTALDGTPETQWFRSADTGRAVVAVSQPIWSGNVQTGALILQQGTDAILSLTNRALTRLIILTLIATIGVAVVLLGYASWLSLRIRRLSAAAEHALDDKQVHAALPSALAGDEVGDLSRSFSSVLRQLGAYNEYLRTLASKLSHELRTPLTIVRSSLENLEHEALSRDALDYTARAREGADRLQKILNAMSEASRVEEMIENAEPETFDLKGVLRSTVDAYADAWPERRFEFTAVADAALVRGAPELIIQMLDKLVDNAVDFTQRGERIGIALEAAEDGVDIVVTNPGPPLPEDMRARLFDSMVSLRPGDDGKHLGLGLYIARLIAEGHDGNISAENSDDGVRFRVRLPAAEDAPRTTGNRA